MVAATEISEFFVAIGECSGVFQHGEQVSVLAITCLGERHLASGSDAEADNLFIWDLEEGSHVMALVGHTAGVQTLVHIVQKNYLASGSRDMSARLWDIKTGVCLLACFHSGIVWALAPLGEDRFATGSGDTCVRTYSIVSGECLVTVKKHLAPVMCMAVC